MSDLESQLWVNTLFRGRQMAEFLAVKQHLGIQSNTDVVRHLVHKQARALLRRKPRSSPSSTPVPLAPRDRQEQGTTGQESGQSLKSIDARSLCFSCPLPDCDETDPGCLYQQRTGRRQVKRARMRTYLRRRRMQAYTGIRCSSPRVMSARRSAPITPDEGA